MPTQFFEHGAAIDDDIEKGTFSLQAAGFRQPGTDTATQQIMLSEATSRTFKANVRQMEDLYSIIGANALRLQTLLHEDYGESVIAVGEHPLNATDIAGAYHIKATFEQIDPVVALQERQQAMEELARGLIDEDTYYRVARYEDPSGIRKGRVRDLVRKVPEVQEAWLIAALREAGYEEIADAKEREMKMRKAAQGQMLMGADGKTPIGAGGQPPAMGPQPTNGRMA